MIFIKDAFISHEKRVVLSNVNIEIQQGDFVYLVGKSGTGKTSLLRVIYGEQKLSGGLGIVLNTDINKLNWRKLPKFRRQMGIISNDYPLLHHISVYQNLRIILKSTTNYRTKKVINQRIQEVLNAVSLSQKINAMPYELSTGEKQRIQIARALLNHTKLIIADEPTTNLDPETAFEITTLLHKICKEHNITFLVATNDYAIIRAFPSRILHIRNGLLQDYASLSSIQL